MMLKRIYFPSLLVFFLTAGCSDRELAPLTIHLVGDSTMADKPDPGHNPERGWGQMLPGVFNDLVTVRNHAVNGRSTKSFIDEGRWNNVLKEIQPGDYVFIQFGHNDQKDQDPRRYSNSYTSYRRNLEKMISESRALGAHPVILSSIVRRKFSEQGTLVDTHGPYPWVARMVAERNNVPFIDLQQGTEDLVAGLGPERSASLFMNLAPGEYEMYPGGLSDNTHLRVSGATKVAEMVAASIKELGIPLAEYLDPLISSPRVLVVVGGHAYDTTEFFRLFQAMDHLNFDSISHPCATGLLRSPYISNYDVLLFYDYMPDLPETDSVIYLNLAREGMPMLFLHHSICSFQKWDGFKQLVGGKYIMEGYDSGSTRLSGYRHDLDIQVEVVNKNHPVTRGISDFTIHDEGYSNIQMVEGITPLLYTDHPECSENVGWINHFDQSTCIYLMLGHDQQAYRNGNFGQLLENSIQWLASDPQR